MNEIIRAAAELQALCESQGWNFCFIGGLAVLRWGEPRETVDVDLTLLTGFGGEQPFVRTLLERYEPRVSDAMDFALSRRVLLVRTHTGVGLDIALGGLPFEASVVARSSLFSFSSQAQLRTCSAEDLVVLKSFAGRAKDWVDIDGVIVRQAGRLDWDYIFSQLIPLAELKDAPEVLDELQRKRDEFEK